MGISSCCSDLSVWVIDDKGLDESIFHWPLSRKGTVVGLGSIVLLISSVIVGLIICDNTENCSQNAWRNEELWGEQSLENGWCERDVPNVLLQQRSNALSNFSFCVTGLVCTLAAFADFWRIKKRNLCTDSDLEKSTISTRLGVRNHLIEFPWFSLGYGLSCIFTGVGSFLFHGHQTTLTFVFDVIGMGLILNALLFYELMLFVSVEDDHVTLYRWLMSMLCIIFDVVLCHRIVNQTLRIDFLVLIYAYVGICVFLFAIIVLIRTPETQRFSICSAVNTKLYGKNQKGKWRLKSRISVTSTLVVVLFSVAYIVQEELLENLYCNPDSWFQFHAMWHTLCAMGFLTIYLGARSERIEYTFEVDSAFQENKSNNVECEDKDTKIDAGTSVKLEEQAFSGSQAVFLA